MKIGFFASGGGSNFKAIHSKVKEGLLQAEVALLISNNGNCGAMEYARAEGIPYEHISAKTHPKLESRERAVLEACADLDLIVLVGYMKHLPLELVQKFQGRILNIHPSLLPAFGGAGCYGIHVHEKAVARGVKYSGLTVHLVTEEYDEGPILWQELVALEAGETPASLQAKILVKEHAVYWRVVKKALEQIQKGQSLGDWINEL